MMHFEKPFRVDPEGRVISGLSLPKIFSASFMEVDTPFWSLSVANISDSSERFRLTVSSLYCDRFIQE